MDEKLMKYPKTDRFEIIDTIGIPHPYCITPAHLSGAGMYLDAEAIREAEKHGAVCDICRNLVRRGKQGHYLSWDEHERALVVAVADERKLSDVPGLKDYLLSIKELAEKDGYAGFAFKQVQKGKAQ